MSCGPACCAMVELYAKSHAEANMEATARELSQRYPGAFEEDSGTSIANLPPILRARGIQSYDAGNFGGAGIWPYLYAYAKDATPAIVHVQWASGAHFVVCVKVYKDNQRCVFLDPFYGVVEAAGSNLPTYIVQDPTGNFPPVAVGKLSGWAVFTIGTR